MAVAKVKLLEMFYDSDPLVQKERIVLLPSRRYGDHSVSPVPRINVRETEPC